MRVRLIKVDGGSRSKLLQESLKAIIKRTVDNFPSETTEYVQEQFIHSSDRCSTSSLIDSSPKIYGEQTTKVARVCTCKVQEQMTANNVELKTSRCWMLMLGILLNENRRNSR